MKRIHLRKKMRLRNLFEDKKVAAFALGRMNPATTGHELLVNAIKNAPGDPFLFLTDRAPKLPDNPLSAEEKLDWARKSFDGINIGLAKTVLIAADRLYKMGYTEVTFLEGEPKLLKLLQQYNGVEKELHNYNFDKINYVQLKRDPEAGDATGMSGTKLRSTVVNNDLDAFKAGVTKQAQPHAEEMFKKLQGLLGVDPVEGVNEIAPAIAAPIVMPLIGQAARIGGTFLLKQLGRAAVGIAGVNNIDIAGELSDAVPGVDANTKLSNYDDAIQRLARNPLPKFSEPEQKPSGPSSRGGRRGNRRKESKIDEIIEFLIGLIGIKALMLLAKAGLTIAAIYAIYKTAKYFKGKYDDGKLEREIEKLVKQMEKEGKLESIDEGIFGTKDSHASIKAQDPNKLKVLDWIAHRADGKEHFISFYRKGAAWSGKLVYIKPDEAKKFMNKVDSNDDFLPQIKQALTNIATTGKLFDRLGIKYQIRRAD